MKKLVLIAALFVTTLAASAEIRPTGTITIIDPSGKTITVTNESNVSVTVTKAESVTVVAGQQIIYVETGATTGEYVETIN